MEDETEPAIQRRFWIVLSAQFWKTKCLIRLGSGEIEFAMKDSATDNSVLIFEPH